VEQRDEDVLVDDGLALRVSRIPAHPRLGRRAREARAVELRGEADTKARELDDARAHRRSLERLVADGEVLLAAHAVWLAGDPTPEVVAVKQSIVEDEAQVEIHRTAMTRHGEAARLLRPCIDGLRALLAEAFLIDRPVLGPLETRAAPKERASRTLRALDIESGQFAHGLWEAATSAFS
jgi:chromosome partition protein MukB